MAYTYNIANIMTNTKDKMRFELGDVNTDPSSAALTDEEIIAVIAYYSDDWYTAKLKLVESVCMRFQTEVSTSIGGVSFDLSERARRWTELYEKMKKEVNQSNPPVLFNESTLSAEEGGYIFERGKFDIDSVSSDDTDGL
jgi:hypothetical protein